jgi:hypothetical protein
MYRHVMGLQRPRLHHPLVGWAQCSNQSCGNVTLNEACTRYLNGQQAQQARNTQHNMAASDAGAVPRTVQSLMWAQCRRSWPACLLHSPPKQHSAMVGCTSFAAAAAAGHRQCEGQTLEGGQCVLLSCAASCTAHTGAATHLLRWRAAWRPAGGHLAGRLGAVRTAASPVAVAALLISLCECHSSIHAWRQPNQACSDAWSSNQMLMDGTHV